MHKKEVMQSLLHMHLYVNIYNINQVSNYEKEAKKNLTIYFAGP